MKIGPLEINPQRIAIFLGIAILLWWFVWSHVRNVKGTLALNDNKPIANPASWMFG